MNLFLEGPRRLGKSTILRNALLPYSQHIAGLLTQRLFAGESLCGFRACVVAGEPLPSLEVPYCQGMEGVFLYNGQPSPRALEDALIRAKEACSRSACRLILLDEIGGMELASPAFRACLEDIFRLGKPCLGTLKSRENLLHMGSRAGGAQAELLRLNEELRRRMQAEGQVLSLSQSSLAEAGRAVESFVAAALEKAC